MDKIRKVVFDVLPNKKHKKWSPACTADGDPHLVVAAKAVELVQLVGSVAGTCSHLPDMKSANNHKRLKQRKQCSQDEFGRYLHKNQQIQTSLWL